MFTTLLESRAARQRRTGSTLASAVLHGAAIAAIVAMTLPGRGDAKVAPVAEREVEWHVRIVPTPPAHRDVAQQPVHQVPSQQFTRVIIPPIATPTSLPPIELSGPSLNEEIVRIGGPGVSSPGLVGPALNSASGGIMEEALVDRAPRVLPGAPDPRYPASLRASGVTGHVVVRFVVDTLGRAELGGVTTVEATHALFGEAVREALGRFRFTPGEVAGRKVRTMVQVPFTFALRS